VADRPQAKPVEPGEAIHVSRLVETIVGLRAYKESAEIRREAAMRAVMRTIETVVVAAGLWVATASAEESTAARPQAIVERQFEAFARDDAEAAYALADPTIKEIFVDADHFMAMVRDRYAPVYRHRSVEFGDFAEHGDEATLKATLLDNDNVVWTALYSLRREPNGDWLISGCVLERSEASAI
jgi:hypothetical protein